MSMKGSYSEHNTTPDSGDKVWILREIEDRGDSVMILRPRPFTAKGTIIRQYGGNDPQTGHYITFMNEAGVEEEVRTGRVFDHKPSQVLKNGGALGTILTWE